MCPSRKEKEEEEKEKQEERRKKRELFPICWQTVVCNGMQVEVFKDKIFKEISLRRLL